MATWTDAKLRALKPKAGRYKKRIEPRLWFVVEPSGLKRWVFRYKMRGVDRALTLGEYSKSFGLSAARAKADAQADLARAARKGDAPEPKHAARVRTAEKLAAPTVAELLDDWLARTPTTERTREERRRTLELDAIPLIGPLKVKQVDRRILAKVVNRVMDRGAPGQALEVFKALRAMFAFAIEAGYLDVSPAAGLKNPRPYTPKTRALSDEEIKPFFAVLGAAPGISKITKAVIEFQLLTAARPGEAHAARWSEIDPKHKRWILAGARVKNQREHRVPLSGAAIKVLERAQDWHVEGDDWIFPSVSAGKPISPLAATRALARLKEKFAAAGVDALTPHDLRRTAASILGRLGEPPHVIERALNHTPQGVTESVYLKHDYFAEREQAMQRLGERVDALRKGRRVAKLLRLDQGRRRARAR